MPALAGATLLSVRALEAPGSKAPGPWRPAVSTAPGEDGDVVSDIRAGGSGRAAEFVVGALVGKLLPGGRASTGDGGPEPAAHAGDEDLLYATAWPACGVSVKGPCAGSQPAPWALLQEGPRALCAGGWPAAVRPAPAQAAAAAALQLVKTVPDVGGGTITGTMELPDAGPGCGGFDCCRVLRFALAFVLLGG